MFLTLTMEVTLNQNLTQCEQIGNVNWWTRKVGA